MSERSVVLCSRSLFFSRLMGFPPRIDLGGADAPRRLHGTTTDIVLRGRRRCKAVARCGDDHLSGSQVTEAASAGVHSGPRYDTAVRASAS